jgi:hypothetical protein
MQTYFSWKVDIWGFPTICCMTHFEFQKASKIAFENRVKKLRPARDDRAPGAQIRL